MPSRLKATLLAAAIVSAWSLPSAATATPTSSELPARAGDLSAAKLSEDASGQRLALSFAGARPTVKSFELSNPKRVVIDFAGATARAPTMPPMPSGLLSALDAVADQSRLRVVATLAPEARAEGEWVGSDYVLALRGTPRAVQAAAPALRAEQILPQLPQPAAKLPDDLFGMEFRKGKSPGSGRLAVEMGSAQTRVEVKPVKGGLIIDFIGANAPASLLRTFELGDQMTPVSSVEAKQLPDRTRLTVRAQGKWEHSAYQIENRFVFEIKPIFNDTMSKETAAGKSYKGDKLTLNFQNIEVRTILQVLSDFSGLNIITSDTVGGTVTLRLKDVPWDQALDVIMQSKNLDKRQEGNVIWIAPQGEIRKKETDDASFRAEQTLNQPLVTESFEINYAKASDVKALLGDQKQAILSPRGSVVVDGRTNTLFIQDIPDRVSAARAMIKKIDIAVKQVMIEARIVEATDTFGKSLGARLGFNQTTPGQLTSGSRFVIGGGISGAAGASGQGSGGTFSDSYFSSLPAQGSGGNSPGLLSLVLFNNAATRFLNLELSALVSDGKGQILSNPRVVTADKTEASIEQGTQIPYQQASSSGATAVAFKNATLALKVTPQITPNGDVMLVLSINKDSVGANTTAGPSIDTKSIKTQVLIEDGGTVVIGGIYTQNDQVSESRVPFFGDLPYIGNLFKTRNTSRDLKEMLVFITPKIVADRAVSDDLDASTAKEDLIKPIMIDQDLMKATGGIDAFPSLPKDKAKKTRSQID